MDERTPSAFEKLIMMNPTLVRGFIVSAAGFLTAVLKVTVLEGQVDSIATFVLALFAMIAAVWIRPAVTPNAKVIVYDNTPLEANSQILPGEAVAVPTDMNQVEKAARVSGTDH